MVKVKVITTRPKTIYYHSWLRFIFILFLPAAAVYGQFICGGDLPNARQFNAHRNMARVFKWPKCSILNTIRAIQRHTHTNSLEALVLYCYVYVLIEEFYLFAAHARCSN